MFTHQLRYIIKVLFKNKTLVFWTFAFPIILGTLFYFSFSDIEQDEMLQVIPIAIVSNEDFQKNTYYQQAFEKLSDTSQKDSLFTISYVDKKEADDLLDASKIKGYIVFQDDDATMVIKENGISQTVLQFVLLQLKQNQQFISDLTKQEIENDSRNGVTSFDVETITNDIVAKISQQPAVLKDASKTNLSYMQIEYYTLIAMACMYGGMLGLTAIQYCLANMSSKGKRVAVCPSPKSILVLASTLGAYFASLVGIFLLLIFLRFCLHVDFGDHSFLVVLLTLIGDLAGISLGVLIGAALKTSENAKIGIMIAISMIFSVLSGMMGVTLKYVIDKNAFLLNLFNPNNLITDGFYALYYYDNLHRYCRNLILLGCFILLCFIISFICLRREEYDSI